MNPFGQNLLNHWAMKTNMLRRLTVCLIAAVFSCLCTAVPAQSVTNVLRIGVYDSRAIAIAYINSADFQNSLKSARADFEKAKQKNDDKGMKAIEARMKLSQRRAHEQGFSTGSVTEVMAKIKDTLPDVARQAGVQMIVSKWELNYQSPEVQTVDVTDTLVASLHPSDKALGWIKDLKKHPPLPIETITDDMD